MKFRPLHDRVVVKRIDAEEKTAGGIIIPDTAKEKPSQGEIVAVGPGGRDESGKLIPIDLKVGDVILFGKWSGTEVKIDGEHLLIMKEILTVDLDFRARPLAEQDDVADLQIDRDELAALIAAAGADGDNLALARLLFGGVGNDDATGGFFLGIDALDDDTVVKRTELHGSPPKLLN